MRPDYAFYKHEWGGSLPEDVFDELSSKASTRVDFLIGFNPVDTPAKQTAYKRAVCAALEAFAAYGDGGGFSIGKYSRQEGVKSGRQIADEDARAQLLRSGLLWGGVA